jgi:hypothetical protein
MNLQSLHFLNSMQTFFHQFDIKCRIFADFFHSLLRANHFHAHFFADFLKQLNPDLQTSSIYSVICRLFPDLMHTYCKVFADSIILYAHIAQSKSLSFKYRSSCCGGPAEVARPASWAERWPWKAMLRAGKAGLRPIRIGQCWGSKQTNQPFWRSPWLSVQRYSLQCVQTSEAGSIRHWNRQTYAYWTCTHCCSSSHPGLVSMLCIRAMSALWNVVRYCLPGHTQKKKATQSKLDHDYQAEPRTAIDSKRPLQQWQTSAWNCLCWLWGVQWGVTPFRLHWSHWGNKPLSWIETASI